VDWLLCFAAAVAVGEQGKEGEAEREQKENADTDRP